MHLSYDGRVAANADILQEGLHQWTTEAVLSDASDQYQE